MTSVEPNGRKIGHDPQNYKRDSPQSIRLRICCQAHWRSPSRRAESLAAEAASTTDPTGDRAVRDARPMGASRLTRLPSAMAGISKTSWCGRYCNTFMNARARDRDW